MSVVARVNIDDEFLIKGELFEGQNELRLDLYGNLYTKKVHIEINAFDAIDLVDDNNNLDGAYDFNDSDEMDTFLAYLFSISATGIPPNKVSFFGESVIANDVIDEQNLEG